jgi:hypothetical protein
MHHIAKKKEKANGNMLPIGKVPLHTIGRYNRYCIMNINEGRKRMLEKKLAGLQPRQPIAIILVWMI